ncbi:hypothetical protein CDAR_19861 [Caerostris darwini]|uniref:Uncharacterized protein n=1 Tax=Caerostris darwini TaxID=1538125 RepID=A0AAV4PWT4_9ARAC|nr:hypothetical protein CDAR_19861 [Caerostris darwini]
MPPSIWRRMFVKTSGLVYGQIFFEFLRHAVVGKVHLQFVSCLGVVGEGRNIAKLLPILRTDVPRNVPSFETKHSLVFGIYSSPKSYEVGIADSQTHARDSIEEELE